LPRMMPPHFLQLLDQMAVAVIDQAHLAWQANRDLGFGDSERLLDGHRCTVQGTQGLPVGVVLIHS
jgi:hypothetical protein